MKNNKLKAELIQTINQKGITNISQFDTSINSEKYLISVYNIIKSISSTHANKFMNDYQNILMQKNIPIFKYDLVILLYKSWIHHPILCNHIIYFAKKIKIKIEDEIVWETIFRKIFRLPRQNNNLRYLFYILAICFKEKIIPNKEAKEFIPVIKSLLEIKKCNSTSMSQTTKKSLHNQYRLLFHWGKIISSAYAKDYDEMQVRLIKMITHQFHVKDYSTPRGNSYHKYIEAVSQNISLDYIHNYRPDDLIKIFEVYKIKPQIFEYEYPEEGKFESVDVLAYFFQNTEASCLFLRRFDKFNKTEKEWFYHWLSGNSLTRAKNLPISLTKKAAYVFRNLDKAPGISIKEGFIYASLISLNLSPDYSHQVVISIRNIEHSHFWINTMVRFFENGLTSSDVGTAMDYIYHMEFTRQKEVNWKHKKVKNLLKDVEAWHRDISITKDFNGYRNIIFDKSKISKFSTKVKPDNYIIIQLKTSKELFIEGVKLHHCVHSYESSCYNNECQIFSLRLTSAKGLIKPLITIEIRDNHVYQALGNYNRRPNNKEIEIIKTWAKENDLTSKYQSIAA
jgi:hypothetical protein